MAEFWQISDAAVGLPRSDFAPEFGPGPPLGSNAQKRFGSHENATVFAAPIRSAAGE
jgi:hypothetical protein